MQTDAFEFDLPPALIATSPADPRDAARLMVIHRDTGRVTHARVRDLPTLGVVGPGDLMIFNDSKVLPAFFQATRRHTAGRVRGLYLGSTAPRQWRLMLESRGKLQPGETIDLGQRDHPDSATPAPGTARDILTLTASEGAGVWSATLTGPTDTLPLLERIGSPPLPPYIRKARKAQGLDEITAGDTARYNTVYADAPGSVAAPTAGLHFTPDLLAALDAAGVHRAYVTLHVGLGTFAPVRVGRIEDHPIHQEWIRVPAATRIAMAETRARGGRILVVGTTAVRALESLPAPDGGTAPSTDATSDVSTVKRSADASRLTGLGDFETQTQLFITPGDTGQTAWPFQHTDCLMTNFHLPRSTLLAMVAALPNMGLPRLLNYYQQAIENEYRFYSYGDAMLIV